MVGHLGALHGVMHALPLTYNKDLQEDEHLFDAAETIDILLAAATGMIAGARFDRERDYAAADELPAATDVADLLVGLGVPFREAHGVVAGLARMALQDGRRLSELTKDELAATARRRRRTRRGFASESCRKICGRDRRSPRAVPRWRACTSRSGWPGRRSMTVSSAEALPGEFMTARVEVARALIGCTVSTSFRVARPSPV